MKFIKIIIKSIFLLLFTLSLKIRAEETSVINQKKLETETKKGSTYRVGYRVLEIPFGTTKITVALWYPTEAEVKETVYGKSLARGTLAENAPILKGSWPLLIHSHGFGGGGIIHASQLEELAANGYIVAAPDHADKIATVRILEKGSGNVLDMLKYLKEHPFTFETYSYRPKEMAAVLDGLLLIAKENQIDKEKIILLGHSMGGWTVTQVALLDTRIKALVLYSMGELNWFYKQQRYFESETLKNIKIPTLFFYGEKESKSNPNDVYAKYCFKQVGGPTYLSMIPDGDHFVYCDKVFAPRSGTSEVQKKKIIEVTRDFLDRYMKNIMVEVRADESRSLSPNQFSSGDHHLTIKVGDIDRKYIVHLPTNYDSNKIMPAVFMLHGGGGTASAAMAETGWAKKADEANFITVFPEGMPPDSSKPGSFISNPQTWNDGSGRFYSGEKNIDDVGFINALIDEIISRFKADKHQIFATGFSNGSSMVYRLGAELSNKIAAIAPIASSGLRMEILKLSRPVPLLVIHGSADPRNPMEGGDMKVFGKIDKRAPTLESVQKWVKLCGYLEEPKILREEKYIKVIAYGSTKDSSEIVFYTIEGMGHTWPGGKSLLPESLVGKATDKLKGNDVIWDFFCHLKK